MTILPLSEGSFTIDGTRQFVPFNHASDELAKRPAGSLLVEIQPFVIITTSDVIVVDTGLGFTMDSQLQLHKNLEANGIQPGQVTKVLMSHLHKDHAGGVAQKMQNGTYQLSFTNATYYVQQAELEYAFQKGASSYMTDELAVLKASPQVNFLRGSGIIDNYIYYEISGGHCPYHQVFRIEDEGDIAFFGGDVAPQLQQMKNRIVAKYDSDGKKSMELRQLWWQLGQQQNWQFLFYHDIKNPVWPKQH